MQEYNIGDKVFWAKYDGKSVQEICPVCFDKKEVIIILGNGEQVATECNYCVIGLSGPRGYVEVYKWVSSVSEIIIDGKEVNESLQGKNIEYRYGRYCLNNGDIFSTKEGAEKRVEEKIREKEIEESKRFETVKGGKKMSLTWSLGYHQKQIRNAEKDIIYHSSKVKLVKSLIEQKNTKKFVSEHDYKNK